MDTRRKLNRPRLYGSVPRKTTGNPQAASPSDKNEPSQPVALKDEVPRRIDESFTVWEIIALQVVSNRNSVAFLQARSIKRGVIRPLA